MDKNKFKIGDTVYCNYVKTSTGFVVEPPDIFGCYLIKNKKDIKNNKLVRTFFNSRHIFIKRLVLTEKTYF